MLGFTTKHEALNCPALDERWCGSLRTGYEAIAGFVRDQVSQRGSDRTVRIAKPPVDTSKAWNAVGGFGLILHAGKNVGTQDALHPRTAAGVSRDGRWLYLLVIDGRQKGTSEGTTTAETAAWLLALGAWDGLNLDGGGSTTLVVDDGLGGAKVLNRPIHLGVPGTLRVNGNHLGVFAKPRA